jgi:hypothetical protein
MQGVVRHILTTAGGYFTATGIASEADTQALVGGAVVLVGIIWSMIDKKNRAEAA